MALVYYLTPAGKDSLWAKGGAGVLPLEYRRMLAMIEFEGHIDVIRGRLRRFPDRLIEEWLRELEELKMIEAGLPGKTEDITFTGLPVPLLPPLADEDSKRLAKTAVIAGRRCCARARSSPMSASPTCRRSSRSRPRP